ncbi:MAG: hydrogen gas-evolving membrane-bound hydrogenase subunit E [Verrucomicrobiales bacterium]
MKLVALITVIITGGLLLYATSDFPAWGNPLSPANASDLSQHYITETRVETEVPNLVTAVLADYRGFDTMFETVVIFVAGLAILSILKRPEDDDSHLLIPVTERHEERDMITIITCQMIVPVIQLFALYVIAHGHYSPGGGFQGGVMLGASYILIALTAGLPEALERLSEQRALFLAALGVAIYAGTGLLCMFLGENFLDYHILSKVLPVASGIQARYHSMLIVEIGVAFTVMSIMFLIYAVLSSKGRMRGGL